MMFHKFSLPVRWGLAFAGVYAVIAVCLYIGASLYVANADPLVDDYADMTFGPYIILSFPGWMTAMAIVQWDLPDFAFRFLVPLAVSGLFYFIVGVIIGGLKRWFTGRKSKITL